MRSAVLIALLSIPVRAEVFEWWQTTDLPLFSRESVSAVVHTQFRMRQQFSDLFQARIGPVVKASIGSPWTLTLGYYFGESEQRRDVWRNNHRTFAAIERPFQFERGSLTMRTMAEHHFGGGNPQDRRFRQSFVWSHRAPLAPYWGTETFFDRQGFMSQRILGGIRYPMGGHFAMDVGYVYDIRRLRAGEHRHAIHTTIRPRRRER